MRKLFDRFKARRVRSQNLRLQRWEQEREKGQTRFVLRQALTWAVLMTSFRDVYEQIFYGGGDRSNLLGYLITYSLVGLFMSYSAWSSQEGAYKNASLNRRLHTPFDDRIKSR
jgi:uncharacterized protein YjaZ